MFGNNSKGLKIVNTRLLFCSWFVFIVLLYPCVEVSAQDNKLENKSKQVRQLEALEHKLQEANSWQSKNIDSALVILGNLSKQSMLLQGTRRYDFQSRIFNEIGNAFRGKGDYIQAIGYYERGIQFSTIHNLQLRKAKLLNSLGGLYQEIEDIDSALKYCKSSLYIYLNNFSWLKKDICMLYANVGNLLLIQSRNKEAQFYLVNAKKINDEINDDYLSSLIYPGLAIVRIRFEDYPGALDNYKLGLKAAERINSKDTKLAILANISSTYVQMRKYDEAELLLLPAYQEALQINHRYLIKEILNLFVLLYSETKQYQKAYEFQKKYSDLKSELFSQELNKRIASIDEKLRSTERQKKILELNQLNLAKSFEIRRNKFILIIISVLSIFTLALIWSYYQRKKAKNMAYIYQMENRMFRLQMKPHFIFNVLSSIGGYMNQNNNRDAGVYLAKFARLIRNVLEQSNKELISLSRELEVLKYYLELQQLRFPNKFDFIINDEDISDPETLVLPPMLIQPIVENAIEHGFSQRPERGNLWINFYQAHELLTIEIIDDGIGINNHKKTNINTDLGHLKNESFSMNLISEHMKYYKIKHHKEFKIIVEDNSEIGTNQLISGTRVVLTLPLIHKNI
jgi:two-component sensor histidine kinase